MPQPDLIQVKRALKILPRPHPQFLNNAFFDPYAGCEFGCVYCYGVKEDFADEGEGESPFRVGVKTNCAFALKKELDRMTASPAPQEQGKVSVGLSFATDPYQPCEEQFQLTLRALETAREKQVPLQIITKSELILRDAKLLAELSREGLCVVSVSLFTTDEDVSRAFEPRVISPGKRLGLIERLRKEGVSAGAFLMPIFPFVTDGPESLEETFSALKSAGAQYCVPGILSLAHEMARERVLRVLGEKFPRACYQYAVLYDAAGKPSRNYCAGLEKILKSCSEKFEIPSVLPVPGHGEKQDLIVKDSL